LIRKTADELWLTGDHFVVKLSAMGHTSRTTQPFIHPESVNEYKSMYITWTTGWKSLKRQSRD